MHILTVNDDGPPSQQSSPYIHSFVSTLQSVGHTVSVILPHQQRSWISKAHFVGQITKPTYFRPGTLHQDDGTTHTKPTDGDEDIEEWVLIDGTPASCVQLGLFHFFQSRPPIDLVISGPNYGRNASALFNLSSGTVGGAMEAAVCGKRAISLSYAFESREHDPEAIAAASKHAVRVVEHLMCNWVDDVDVYNINVPLVDGIMGRKVLYTNVLQNHWTMGSSFKAVKADNMEQLDPEIREKEIRQGKDTKISEEQRKHVRHQHKHFKWAPRFEDVKKSVAESEPGNDGWAILQGYTSVTPLQANFMHSSKVVLGELKLTPLNGHENSVQNSSQIHATIDYQDDYVQPIIISALRRHFKSIPYRLHDPAFTCPPIGEPWLQIRQYESLDFEVVLSRPTNTFANSYIIRKALIRKHYLAQTVSEWLTKHPNSILKDHVKPSYAFEVDYAEFLDDALLEAYELKGSLESNKEKIPESREWWILKPGMSDRGQGVRIFSTMEELRSIFDKWDPDETDDDDGADSVGITGKSGLQDGIMTSHLRHFVAQPYISRPLLLPRFGQRKFHIRVYVLAVGALQIYVYNSMLMLFSSASYNPPGTTSKINLAEHLTNTCLQPNVQGESSVLVSSMTADVLHDTLTGGCDGEAVYLSIFNQISSVTAEIFEAAAKGQMIHFQTLPNAFEVFGLDFLVDGDQKIWLLEVNAFPDFAQSGMGVGREVVEGFWDEVFEVAVRSWVEGLGDDYRIRESDSKTREEIDGKLQGGKKQLIKVLDIDLGRR